MRTFSRRVSSVGVAALLALALGLACSSDGGGLDVGLDGGAGDGGHLGRAGSGGLPHGGGGQSGTAGGGGQSGQGGQGGMSMCAKCAAPPSPACKGTGPCGCGPYVCPQDGGAPDAQPLCGAGSVCADLEARWAAAWPRAQGCDPNAADQCLKKSWASLSCRSCTIWVNSTAELDPILEAWNQAGCTKCLAICPAVACINPGVGVCREAPIPPSGLPAGSARYVCSSAYPK